MNDLERVMSANERAIDVYSDQSRNPITAARGVEMLLRGLQTGLAGAMAPGVNYSQFQGRGVSASDYNALVTEYNDLAGEVDRLRQLLALREHENQLLRQLAAARQRG